MEQLIIDSEKVSAIKYTGYNGANVARSINCQISENGHGTLSYFVRSKNVEQHGWHHAHIGDYIIKLKDDLYITAKNTELSLC